jgi:hypothetical protein
MHLDAEHLRSLDFTERHPRHAFARSGARLWQPSGKKLVSQLNRKLAKQWLEAVDVGWLKFHWVMPA